MLLLLLHNRGYVKQKSKNNLIVINKSPSFTCYFVCIFLNFQGLVKSISLNSKFPWHWQTTALQNKLHSITLSLPLLNIICCNKRFYIGWKINMSRFFCFFFFENLNADASIVPCYNICLTFTNR